MQMLMYRRLVLFTVTTMVAVASVDAQSGSILNFEFEGMHIGVSEYEEGPTGTTVFYFPDGVMGAADIRGGATGTMRTPSSSSCSRTSSWAA